MKFDIIKLRRETNPDENTAAFYKRFGAGGEAEFVFDQHVGEVRINGVAVTLPDDSVTELRHVESAEFDMLFEDHPRLVINKPRSACPHCGGDL